MQQPTVLVIGGGIGGLALAHGLLNHNIPFRVFERDRTENYRAQGYRIRISPPAINGLQYLLRSETMELFDLSCAEMRMAPIPDIDAETGKVTEPNVVLPEGWTYERIVQEGLGRVVDRAAFREVLIKDLPAECIEYDKVFTHYEERGDGVIAFFEDGSSASGSMLIGADGRSSKTRKQLLPDLRIEGTGIHCFYGKTLLTPEVISELDASVLDRMSFIRDRSHAGAVGLEPIRFGNVEERRAKGLSVPDNYLFWALSASSSSLGFDTNERSALSVEESEHKVQELSAHWVPGIKAMIKHQTPGETSVFPLTITEKDFGSKPWEPNARVTLIGDAVHPMAPTGSGAVTAITDARAICEGLVGASARGETEAQGYKDVIGAYEEIMRKTAAEALPASWHLTGMLKMLEMKGDSLHMGEMASKNRLKNLGKPAQ